jgi:hypothetical protein
LGYSLILPSSWFGVVREESGAKWWCVTIYYKKQIRAKERLFRAERRGEGRDEFSLHNTRRKTA